MVVKGMSDIQVAGMQQIKTFGLFLLTKGLFKNNGNWMTIMESNGHLLNEGALCVVSYSFMST